ncbi:hypothetical protein Slin15195_G074760 [Septoria linicola]|uniref:Uncharacterized protein n=1 Tax=Septoria linicola TaxID=215465 RepID=A0A9Q9AR21_9PEZI|nr:hypothetical protein Slin15195_G074760 [Septoria linicola]
MASTSPSPSPGAAIVADLQTKLATLMRDHNEGLGINHCANLMFNLLLDFRSIPRETCALLTLPEILKLDEICQDAIQAVGWHAQWRIAPRCDPTEADWSALSWRPGVATKMRVEDREDPLALRLHVLRMDMCELWNMDPRNGPESKLVDFASEVLRLCSGEKMSVGFDNGQMIYLNTIKFPAVEQKSKLRLAVFECVLLTLVCVSRWHAAWVDTMMPAKLYRGPVRLWGQGVPGTSFFARRAPEVKAGLRATDQTLSRRQKLLFKSLENDVEGLIAIPWLETPRGLGRAEKVVAVIRSAIEGRSLKRDPKDKHIDDRLFTIGQKAIDNIFIAARIHFKVKDVPSSPSVFVASASPRPRPNAQDHVGLRRWQILRLLDRLQRREPPMSVRLAIVSLILQHVEGEGLISKMQEGGDVEELGLPPVQDKSLEWRTEMLRFTEFAIVGMAQHLSSRFDDRQIMLVNKVVEMDKTAGEAEGLWVTGGQTESVSFTRDAWSKLVADSEEV